MMKNFVEAKIVKSWISDEKELAFIDVRETAQHTAGHPIFSISIPFSEFEINIEKLLPNKRVRIVLFDNNDGISEITYKLAKNLKYIKIFIFCIRVFEIKTFIIINDDIFRKSYTFGARGITIK